MLVTEAPLGADLAGAFRWEDFKRKGAPDFVMRQKDDVACIVYSSGTGGRPKGCVLTHENYLEQCMALTAWYPFWPGVRYLSILPTNHAIDFMVGSSVRLCAVLVWCICELCVQISCATRLCVTASLTLRWCR